MSVPVEAVACRKDILVELNHRYHGRVQQLLRDLYIRCSHLEDTAEKKRKGIKKETALNIVIIIVILPFPESTRALLG